MATASTLKPLAMSPELHRATKLLAAMEGKQIWQFADDLYLPVAKKRAGQLNVEIEPPKKKGAK